MSVVTLAKPTPGPWYAEDRTERTVILAEGYGFEVASVEQTDSDEAEGGEHCYDCDEIFPDDQSYVDHHCSKSAVRRRAEAK